MNRVFVLNSGYECVGRCKLARAFSLVGNSLAEIVKNTGNVIRSVSGVYEVPMIIRVYKHIPLYHRKIKFSNRMVWERDNYTCRYCGVKIVKKTDLTTDHVKPKSKGGKSTYENMATACASCNSIKADNSLERSGMRLLGDLPLVAPSLSTAMRKVNEEVRAILVKDWDSVKTVFVGEGS